jgi:choline dehydrogenase-like flavoprotein
MLDTTGLLSDDQFRTLEAVCATLTPPPASGGDFPSSPAAGLALLVIAPIAELSNRTDRRNFQRALTFLESRLVNLVLAGKFRRFTRLDRESRERVLAAWAASRIGLFRAGFQTFKRLALFFHYARPDDQTGVNPHWAEIDYPGPRTPPREVAKPIIPLTVTKDTVLDADVVVIGSGAGGGVVAAELATAGHQVLVLEKSGYANESDFDGAEVRSTQRLFEKKGILTTRDVGVVLLAGSTLGGGTTVNWSTSLRTPDYVLKQWAEECGVTAAASAEWQAGLDAVCNRLHVNTDASAPNRQDQKLIAGCTALGYHWRPISRNVNGCQDCGYCSFGCRFGAKQGVLKTYLQDAVDRGAQVVVHCHVDRVTVQHGVATGVEATVNGHRLTIRSKIVVVAAGSIHTPAVLKRSGLVNPNIGRHLHLHPVGVVFGIYDEVIESWRGPMQASVCDQFANLDNGYGFVVEVAPAHPGMLAMGLPWHDAQGHRELMSQANHIATFIVITRDRDGGTVNVDERGQPVLDYTVSTYDARHLLRGAQEAARLHAAAGAHTVGGPYNHVPEISLRKGRALEAYASRFPALGVLKNDMTLYSAHQMSSCRMGGNRAAAPVTPDGETYEVKNLYVADASALPTATGVNPMISIMALAHRNAQVIKSRH